MIDSETFFAKYLLSPRIQQTESDQRLTALNAVQTRFSPDRKIKSSFLQDEISFAPKNSQLLSQTIRSLLKNSWDLVEAIKEKNLIDPHLQYHLRKFKNDHESVSDLINRKTFDNMEHLNIYKDQINQLQTEIVNLNEKCKHRKVCLQKLNDILNRKEEELLHLTHSLNDFQLENQALQNQQEELNCQNIQLIEELQNVISTSQQTISQLNLKIREGENKFIQLKSGKEQENHTQLNQTSKQVEEIDSIRLKLKKQESQIGLLTEQNQEKHFEIESLNQSVLQCKEQIKQNEFEIRRFKDLCASQEDKLNQQCNQETSTLLLFTQRENELTQEFNNIQKELQQQIAQYQKDQVELKGKITSLIQKELHLNQQIKQLEDSQDIQEKVSNIQKQEKELESLKSLSQKQNSQLEIYQEQNYQLKQDKELLSTELITLKDQIRLYEAEIKRLTDLQVSQEDQLKAYSNQTSFRSNEQEQQQNSKQIEQKSIQQKDYQDLQAKLSQIMQKEILSHQKIKILEDQVSELEELNKNLLETNSKQKKQLSNLNQQCQQHDIQFELQFKERQTLEELIAQNKQKLIFLEEKLNQSIFTIQQYEQQIQNQQLQLSILNQTQQELQFYQQQFQALSTNFDESKLQIERVLKQKEDLVVQLENTINTNSQLQTSNKTLEQKYKLIENNHSSLTQENKRLQNWLNDSIIISKQKELENQELQKLNETCHKQITQLQHQYTQLEQSYHQIESDKQAINLQQNENSNILEQSILENESKLTKLQKYNQDLKEEINQLKTNQNEKEHLYAQTVKQFYQKNQGIIYNLYFRTKYKNK
ncbi:unnamed protein product (macronuclear) [Paramecium tetraurelia]|uniref:Uncharacterized protein n=1 Tax=Paramecium tetraurelia TaxID=5888 RepID=A0DJE2_PARTE|nr:uncharacterized protein GSPATT00017503001 [Paramecium tetraurelia]CAK83159.1 unnamed protein product [Paramecium tetraurelia]|eukprot:XP_001450556.1 hypothetical protein (macronuclear) [Paramecium tetraurelia strain d4-2]